MTLNIVWYYNIIIIIIIIYGMQGDESVFLLYVERVF